MPALTRLTLYNRLANEDRHSDVVISEIWKLCRGRIPLRRKWQLGTRKLLRTHGANGPKRSATYAEVGDRPPNGIDITGSPSSE